jgi:gliding motility-associated-like protein
MDSNLTTIKWSAFLGGNSEDALYSIIVHDDSSIYVAGGTKSGDFPTTPFAHLKNAPGSMDGFITKIMKNGQGIYQSTYVGTSAYDQTFFVRKDHEGGVYFFGQTEGSVTPSAGCFSAGNSKQTLGKFSSNLDTLRWITTFGSGNQAGPNISPTAFEVDSCGRIYLAGWGGEDNRITNTHAGYTDSLPLRNPFQAKTDSSDFYLMALEQNASTLLFGSYLGGNKSADHVDGGTSRFDSKGIMYHAVCASCGSATNDFPTTANAWSRTENSGNCNLAVFKFDFRSAAILRAGFEIDSTKAMCAPLDLVPKNTSIGPKTLKYLWTTSTGQVDTAFEPHLLFSFPGYYTIKLLVWDSAGGPCSKADSLEVSFRIKDRQLKADFLAGGQLNRCAPLDINYLASCTGATFDTKYIWYLNGDSVSSDPNPKIHIDSSGKYVVRLVAIDSSTCNIVDSLDQKLTLSSLKRNLLPPTACFCKTDSNLKLEPLISGKDYTWSGAGSGTIPLIKPEKTGLYILKMKDSLDCDQIDSIDIVVNDCGKEIFNVITPNSDGANDEFQPIPMEDAPDSYQLTIFNRWGQPVFRSRNHQESWKGTSQISGDALPDSTYFFELRATYCNGFKVEKSGIIKLIR